jgi:hypothetical protein
MAHSHRVPTGHAIALGAYLGGCVLSLDGAVVLVPDRAILAERDKLSSLVSGLISLSGHATLRHSFSLPGVL